MNNQLSCQYSQAELFTNLQEKFIIISIQICTVVPNFMVIASSITEIQNFKNRDQILEVYGKENYITAFSAIISNL